MLKSLYVSAFIAAGVGGLVVSILRVVQDGLASPWLGTALACLGPVGFFARAYAAPIARTSANMPLMLIAGAAGTALAAVLGGAVLSPPVVVAAAVGLLGSALYLFWYSRFAPPGRVVLTTGAQLPDFELREGGAIVRSGDVVGQAALWMFYRGNWCPLCMAQIREVAAQYRELAARGVQVIVVSPQPESHTAVLARKFDVPMRFMTDSGNAAARTLGILEENGLPAGMQVLGYDSDVPRPTVFITAPGGRLIYCDLSENYRVRPEPAEFLAVLDARP
jgi:peroxiredoxin